MKPVIFGAGLPSELSIQQAPTARAEGDAVVVTLVVQVTETPGQTAPLDLVLNREFAAHLLEGLSRALQKLA